MTSNAKGIGEDGKELDGIFTLKEEQNMALRDFLRRKDGFTFLLTGFGKSFSKNCRASQHARIDWSAFFFFFFFTNVIH